MPLGTGHSELDGGIGILNISRVDGRFDRRRVSDDSTDDAPHGAGDPDPATRSAGGARAGRLAGPALGPRDPLQ